MLFKEVIPNVDTAFVGRLSEIEKFHRIINDTNDVRILKVIGKGGVGKTWLLKRFQAIINQEYPNIVMGKDIVDMYFTENQHEFGALYMIASQIDPDATFFSEFFRLYQSTYVNNVTKLDFGEVRTPLERDLETLQLYGLFVESLNSFLVGTPLVLLIDTAEEAKATVCRLIENVLKKLRGNILIVIAGRTEIDTRSLLNSEVDEVRLEGLSLQDSITYFRHNGFDANDLSDKEIIELHTRSEGGQPIFLAIIADLLLLHPVEKLLDLSSEEFKFWLVEQIANDGTFENLAVRLMAYAWRRFNSHILSDLTGENLEKCIFTLENLKGRLYIKYVKGNRSNSDVYLLHDKMRDLVEEHIWKSTDRSGKSRRSLSERLVKYYEDQIGEIGHRADLRVYKCEQLYYKMESNLDEGFVASRELFLSAILQGEPVYSNAILQEVDRFKSRLSSNQEREFRLWSSLTDGWLQYQGDKSNEAIREWEDVYCDTYTDDIIKFLAASALIEAHSDGSELTIAENYSKEAWKVYKRLDEDPGERAIPREILVGVLGLLHNNIGYLRRRQERWEDAITQYEHALDLGLPRWLEARARNNLGYAHHLLGRSELAFSYCASALRIRQRLRDPYELGLSYNVLGILYVDSMRIPEAEASFERALMHFDSAQRKRGKAMVYVALGKLYRQWGWYEEQIVGKGFDPDREKYCKAQGFLLEAVDIYSQEEDEAGLAEALGELGATYRERRIWIDAVAVLTRALQVADSKMLQRRMADVLQDLSMTYWRRYQWESRSIDDINSAQRFAERAMELIIDAENERESNDKPTAGFSYLLSKAEWTLGDIAFEQAQYDDAMGYYSRACVNITKLDPTAIGHDSAKKALHYDDLTKHVVKKILALPHEDDVSKAVALLTRVWQESGLQDKYRGFIEKVEAAKEEYSFYRTATD